LTLSLAITPGKRLVIARNSSFMSDYSPCPHTNQLHPIRLNAETKTGAAFATPVLTI
jgi:hypothetical protein